MVNRRRNNNVTNNSNLSSIFKKTLKNYFVAIIWLFLIVLLIFNFFSGSSKNELNNTLKYENQVPLNISLDSDITEAYIVYPGENKVKLEDSKELYKWETILVKEWSVSINFLSVWDFKLSKLWELTYSEEWDLSLNSWDLFINSNLDLVINMKYAKVMIWKNSTVSISQNEMSSSIYLLAWNVEVRNLIWKSSVLAKWQKISVSRLESSSNELDLSQNKEDIDEFFKASDWFILNNWSFYLSQADVVNNTQSGSTVKTNTGNININTTNNNLITFDNLVDESYVSSNTINISWKYLKNEITKISLNNIDAVLDKDAKTFSFKNISVSKTENNLIFKIYDDSNDLLQKFIYIVYFKTWETVSNSTFQVTNYNVDWSQFTFTEPSTSNTFTTNDEFVTIRWQVNAKWISKVSVNDFELSSFNWSTWRYHASITNNNLKEWTNIYNIKYFDTNWKIVYTNNYTIIKKPITNIPKVEVKETSTSTGEIITD